MLWGGLRNGWLNCILFHFFTECVIGFFTRQSVLLYANMLPRFPDILPTQVLLRKRPTAQEASRAPSTYYAPDIAALALACAEYNRAQRPEFVHFADDHVRIGKLARKYDLERSTLCKAR